MIEYAEVAINLPIKDEDTLTYEIPFGTKNIEVGKRVEIEVRNRKMEGVIIDIHNVMPSYKTKPIGRVIDKQPVITKDQIELGKWMKDFYVSTLGESLYKMIPSGRRNISNDKIDITVESKLLNLNPEQENAYRKIRSDFGKESIHLLYGITGSGKTEVYIHLMHTLLNETNKSAILLVPEISLTVQILKRLQLIFGSSLAMLHSAMKVSDKFRNYQQILRGEKRIIVGTRSAIFAPVKDLGLIILDEEHDGSYKEHSNPRYHARQIAMQRAKMGNAVVVLGSATPSVESFYHAKRGNIQFHTLKNRAKSAELSKVFLQEKKEDKEIISDTLLFKIKQRLDKKEQVVLLLNRRGHSPLIYSKSEKKILECPNCSTNLCYHNKGKAVCHLCGYNESYSKLNDRYQNQLDLMGAGTQKLEEYLLEKFPNVLIERLDQDATKNKEILADVIGRLIERKIDILTGTQMIAKGLDASHVTLVGVINANTGLGLPDFRASERVYSLLTQVAGRAGRSELKGEVIIETFNSSHPVIQFATRQNYDDFFDHEILVRKDLHYPPFCRLIRLLTRSKIETKSADAIELIRNELDKKISNLNLKDVYILGPAPAPFYKIDSNFRNHIVIKTNSLQRVRDVIRELKMISLPSNVYLEIDIDPMDLV
ncbi:MAG TPA: primosomal protein N' [Leptospiraceae bacterium]|nr:primosomal protein N' [Leptospiraceae bacterium]HMY30387.1 primosomal protein N' [Leptospiraceae bacterium]HMZ66827.1 primosomal protein N' [Leptospiraceae bacterium]HNA07080.1 primosomal protein N' [Leptospiraceae bacterium]HNB99986.1 primosomal protein N' [Leptospiraceae bacterium]